MSLQDWGALGELVGGIAIIVSLFYVGLQINQSTKATRAATNQSFGAQYSGIMLQLARADVSKVFWKGINGLENLKGRELPAYMAFMAAILRTYETFYFEAIEGRFESKMFDSWLMQLTDLFGNEGVIEYWELRQHNFSHDFVKFVDQKVSGTVMQPMYPEQPSKTT